MISILIILMMMMSMIIVMMIMTMLMIITTMIITMMIRMMIMMMVIMIMILEMIMIMRMMRIIMMTMGITMMMTMILVCRGGRAGAHAPRLTFDGLRHTYLLGAPDAARRRFFSFRGVPVLGSLQPAPKLNSGNSSGSLGRHGVIP